MKSLRAVLACWLAGGALAAAASGQIICGPYVQMPAPDSMGVAWETAKAAGGTVEYGPAGEAATGKVTAPDGQSMHYVTLKGLKPATEYWYQVVSDGATSEKWTFRTAPTGGQDVETRIVIWSDVQHGDEWITPEGGFKPGTPANWTGAGEVTRGNMAEMMKFKPHLQFAPGDLANRGNKADEWRHLINILRPLCATAPLMAVPGNHDLADGGVMWRRYFRLPANAPEPRGLGLAWSLDYGDVHLISAAGAKDKSSPLAKQAAEARKRGAKWVLAGSHSFWEGGGVSDSILAAGLDFYFCGHTHSYHRSFPLAPADRLRQGIKVTAERDRFTAAERGLIIVTTGTMGSYGAAAARAHNDLNAAFFTGGTRTFCRLAIRGERLEFGTFDHLGKCHDAFTIDRSDTAEALPKISAVKAECISGYAAAITWATDVGAFSAVEYGPAGGEEAGLRRTAVIQDFLNDGGKSHRVALYALTPGTEYRFRVKCRRDAKWAVGEWGSFTTPAGRSGDLVCVLNFAPRREYHVGGTWVADESAYAADIGFGWTTPAGEFSATSQDAYNIREERPKGLPALDPTGPEGRYRMARSRVRVANSGTAAFRLDVPDGAYKATFCLGSLFQGGTCRVRVGKQEMLRKEWPDRDKHSRDWSFMAKHAKVIRTAADEWAGQDELDLDVDVAGGRLTFEAGMKDSSQPQAGQAYKGTGINYLIVRRR